MVSFKDLFSIVCLVSVSASLMAQTREGLGPEGRRVDRVAQEWRAANKFDKDMAAVLEAQLELVIDSQLLLRRTDLDKEIRDRLEAFQGAGLKRVIADDKTVMPYLLRYYAETVRELNRGLPDLSPSTKKMILARYELRLEALDAAIKSIGLSAIPPLSEFQTFAARAEAQLLKPRIQTLITEIVKRGEQQQVEAAKLTERKSSSEVKERSTAAPTPLPPMNGVMPRTLESPERDASETRQ